MNCFRFLFCHTMAILTSGKFSISGTLVQNLGNTVQFTFLNRALNICSNFSAFKEKLKKIKNYCLRISIQKFILESKINEVLDFNKIDNSTFNIMKILTQKITKRCRI